MLNCMATCRCTDKKPCDNIMEEPTITQLVEPIPKAITGGGTIGTLTKKIAFNALGSSIATDAGTNIVSRYLMEPANQGEILCPSVR